MARRIAFVTGKLAEPAVRRVTAELAPRYDFEPLVSVLNISVAGLMTTEWVARHLRLDSPVDLVLLPGLCRGDPQVIEDRLGVPVRKGPKDIWQLARFFGGRDERPAEYGAYSIEIIAEINNCPELEPEEVLRRAEEFRRQGADVIDVGCSPGQRWLGVSDCVRRLVDAGYRVSVDTLDPWEAAQAARAGAELVLSVTHRTAPLAADWGCEVVAIPERPGDWGSLEQAVERLERLGVKFRIDPILEPIGSGFAQSIGRYLTARRRWPQCEMLMGVGNITELTDADSAPINVLLAGICEELRIRSVLTTSVINWCRTSVRELDLARRLVHFAVRQRVPPKNLEPDLVLLRDPRLNEPDEGFLAELAERIKDPNYRIFAAGGKIHAINNEGHRSHTDPFALFRECNRTGKISAEHAFYLGYEMCKAFLALTLAKNYVQDEPLRWGFLTPEEKYGHS